MNKEIREANLIKYKVLNLIQKRIQRIQTGQLRSTRSWILSNKETRKDKRAVPEVHGLKSYLTEKPEKANRPPVESEVPGLESYSTKKPQKTNWPSPEPEVTLSWILWNKGNPEANRHNHGSFYGWILCGIRFKTGYFRFHGRPVCLLRFFC